MSSFPVANARSSVLHRDLRTTPPSVVSGDGAYLVDADGQRWLDASGGAAVSCLGHSHRHVTQAVARQIELMPYAHTGFFTNEPAETLAQRLVELAPTGFGPGRVAFVGSGSEAMEAAMKLARQHFVEKGEPARARFISRRMSYHGNTLGALAVGGHAGRRALYQPLLIETHQIAPCFAYRFQEEGETLEAYGRRAADELETAILALGPETVAAFVAEPVVGATIGSVPAAPGYFARIREICDRYGVLFIADEVMCGMGRCGTLFACEAEGVVPDLITIAKGLGAGYQPIAALMVREHVVAPIATGTGMLAHGHTYMSHAVSCAAANAVLDVIATHEMMRRVNSLGAALREALETAFGDHPHVGDIRGRGLFLTLELVRDRATKEPFAASAGLAGRIKAAAFAEGLIAYPSSGTADGKNGDHVLLAPPYIIHESQIEEMVTKLKRAMSATFRSL